LLGRIAHQIVRLRKAILAVALLLALFGAFGLLNAGINYDLFAYLPEELASVQGFEILNEDFQLGNTAQIMIDEVTPVEAARYVEQLEEIEGIEQVSWADDLTDLAVPREFWPESVEENYFEGDATLIQVSFEVGGTDPRTRQAFLEIKDLLADETAWVTGAEQIELEDVMTGDQVKIGISALVLVTIVLILTIPSIIVPLLFVATIGLSVLYNLGLAYYIGQEMSYITGVIVFALQFAVTMDYALFLYHRFEEEKREHEPEVAMERAIVGAFKSITAASATTIAGFLALSVMRLGFGADMGFTLARGVLITVIGVFTILPALLLTFDKLIERFSHRTHMPDFERLGGFIGRHAGVFSLVGLLLFVPAVWGYLNVQQNYDLADSLPDGLPSSIASDEIAERFGRQTSIFLIVEDTGSNTDLEDLTLVIEGIEGVSGAFAYTDVVDPLIPDEFIPEEAREAFFSEDYTYINASVEYDFGDARTESVLERIRATADAYPGETFVTGEVPLLKDMEDLSSEDVNRVNVVSIVAIFIIVMIAFRSVSVPVVLLAAIQLAIFLNQGISGLMGQEIIFFAILAIGAIQLGATVDYAILLTSRFEEEVAKTGDRRAAIAKALGESAPSILVSAGTLFAATIGMVFLTEIGIISQLATLISRGAVISFLVVVFLLPAVLVVGQPVFERTSIRWPKETRER
jgi:predicted RND superfamily exporter protein